MDKTYTEEDVTNIITKIEEVEQKILAELELLTTLKKSIVHHSTLSEEDRRTLKKLIDSKRRKRFYTS